MYGFGYGYPSYGSALSYGSGFGRGLGYGYPGYGLGGGCRRGCCGRGCGYGFW